MFSDDRRICEYVTRNYEQLEKHMKKNTVTPVCTFDPRVVPASVPDSWLALSREIDYTPPGFYLRTCQSVRDGSTFGIELLDAKGGPINAQPSSSPALTVMKGRGAY